MDTKYFRVAGYHPTENLSIIMDSNGMFEKLWQLSSLLIQKGFKIVEVSSDEKFLDGNISKEPMTDKLILRAHKKGEPLQTVYECDGVTYHAIKVGDKTYIPDREKKVNGGAK
jgi:hypothetical protein